MNDPYPDSATNLIYHLLFCDDIALYKAKMPTPYTYPFDILFSGSNTVADLQKVIDDTGSASRVKILAYNGQLAKGHIPDKKELLAVIIEVGMDEGTDVLASYHDGSARYINYSGKIIIWETADATSSQLTDDMFLKSGEIVKQIGPWNQPRRPFPPKGTVRISFLVSDGLYFGEGPMDVLFKDPLASPALNCGVKLMQYLTEPR